jgi:hypothetical protein
MWLKNRFKKGDSGPISTIGSLVLLVIILVGVAAFFMYSASAGTKQITIWEQLMSWYNKQYQPVPTSYLEAVVLCSYYRCMNGCDSFEVENAKWNFEEDKVNCKEDFCKEGKDPQGKICSGIYAINLNLSARQNISTENLKLLTCILEADDVDSYTYPNVIQLDKNLSKSYVIKEKDYCTIFADRGSIEAIKRVELKGKLFIWTNENGNTLIWSKKKLVPSQPLTRTTTITGPMD